MKRRLAKKLHKRQVLARREALGHPVPCPPEPTGRLLVPDWYVGWIRITTPGGRAKIRWVNQSRRVFRDNHSWHGGGFHINLHARNCVVEPVDVAQAVLPRLPMVFAAGVPESPLLRILAHEALLSAGMPHTAEGVIP